MYLRISFMKSLILASSLLAGVTAFSQVCINEFSCSNVGITTDAFGEYEDWVELYNSGASAFDLSGYYLSDNSSNLSKWEIPAGASVPAGGYTMIYFSGRDLLSGTQIHPSFGLTQTKNDWIVLSSPSGNVVDSLKLVKMTQKNHSYGRTTNAAPTWSLFTTPTPNASNTGATPYYTAKPTMSVAPGFYTGAQNVTISTTDAAATIHYTTDGTTPTLASPTYSGPVNISATTVLRARCFSSTPGVPPSFVETNTYFINSPHTIPVLSLSGDQITDFLNDVAPGSFSSNFDGAFEYFDYGGTFIDEGEGYYNKHGNDSWAYDQRACDFVMKDEYGYNSAIMHQIFPSKARDEYQRLIIKCGANDNYPASGGAHLRDAYVHTISAIGDLRVDERTSLFVVVYVDGVYWGLYDLREKVDDSDFTNYYYQQDKYNIDFIKTWGGTWAEYGDPAMTEWNALYTYITTNDMSIQANYDYVQTKYNTGSLIDYVVLNSYVVTSDWLNWNTAWWKGNDTLGDKKTWRYALWDNDATFGHYINYTGVPSTAPDADPCNVETLSGGSDPEGHITILNALFQNPTFSQEYITRYADLSNGVFSCVQMHAILDSMVAVMTPEMAGQTGLWGGTVGGWQANVQTLKDYIDARCAAITSGMVDCYDLTGPFNLTVNVDPPGSGTVKANSEWVPVYPWTGLFYGNITTLFKAQANTGYTFDYWESTTHVFSQPDSLNDTLNLAMADSVIAHFVADVAPPDPPGPPGIPPGDYTGFHMPNAFSPNADLNNDILTYFLGYDVESFNLKIFDRWGNMVFATQTNGEYWDGYYKGKLVNTGIYTYTLDYKIIDQPETSSTGNITLIR
jgi:gliding motility-associated-like protein